MSTSILGPEIHAKFESIRHLLARAQTLAVNCSNPQAATILGDRLAALDAAALFVIVGEVKAGKSSFINALLGEEVCEVAPDPCTAVIQELVYGTERKQVSLGDHWERRTLPAEALRSISIVDTPGTNSIIRNHQTITEQYIPRSDLVVFVFSAKNPHTSSAWDLLTYIRQEWHRKIVFVLQQADLASEHELNVNVEKVKQYARERNLQNPIVFSVSAKKEIERVPDSGFDLFREYLLGTIKDGEIWQIKFAGSRETLRKVLARLTADLVKNREGFEADLTFISALESKVEARKEKANSLKRLAVDSLCLAYERIAERLKDDFTAGLGISNILRRSLPFVRDKDLKSWLSDTQKSFEENAKSEIEAEANRVSKDICREMSALFEDLTQSIESHQSQILSEALPSIEDRSQIFARLKSRLDELKISDIVSNQSIGSSELGNLTLTGGGIAALGAVIALATKILIFDITGGIIAGAGMLIVAATLLWRRRSIITDFERKLNVSKSDFRSRLDAEITGLFDKIFIELEYRLTSPGKNIRQQIDQLSPLLSEARECEQEATAMI